MNFRDLSPEERRLVVHGYLAELPPDEGAPRLAPETLAAIRRAELALVTFELTEDEREQELELWREHLDGLTETEEDAAVYRLASFVAIFGGLRATSPTSNGAGRVVGPENEEVAEA
jgi:hypothetical protein